MIEVATCSYSEYRPEMGIAVRTSVGAPKWFPHPAMSWENAFPKYHWLKLPFDEYRRRYLAMLDEHGVEKLRGDLEFIVETHAKLHGGDVQTVVLLCYEKLSKPGSWCHRTLLSEWLQQNLHTDVVELGAKPSAPPEPEQTLF